MSANMQTFAPILKTLYPPEAIKNLVYPRNPFYALVPKNESFYGDSAKEPLLYGLPQNSSNTFSVANTGATNSNYKAFLLTRVPNYAFATMTNELILSSKTDEGAFLRGLKAEMDNAYRGAVNNLAAQLYRSGSGTVAQISSTAVLNAAGTPVATAGIGQAVNLEPGMALGFSATDGGALKPFAASPNNVAYVVTVDTISGNFQVSNAPGGAPIALNVLIPTIAVNDWIYPSTGDVANSVSGLSAWVPGGSVVTSAPFFNVDRTAHKTRLAGILYDGTSQNIEEALIDAAGLVAQEGGNPDYVFMSFKDYRNLTKTMLTKQFVTIEVPEDKVQVGFQALELSGPSGAMKVIPDKNCPVGVCYILQLDSWCYKSLGSPTSIVDLDGTPFLRDPNSDAFVARLAGYTQLSCRAPGWNARVLLPS